MKILICLILMALGVSCAPKKPQGPERKVVIGFVSDPENVSEDWNWFGHDITEKCKSDNFLYIHADPKTANAKVEPDKEVYVDVSAEIKEHGQGWVLVKDGKKVGVIKYDLDGVDQVVDFCKKEK